MQSEKYERTKQALTAAVGVLSIYTVYATFLKPVAFKAPGKEPPKSILTKHLSWFLSKGPFLMNGYARLIEDYFQEQNWKSFWTFIPGKYPTLETVDPVVIKETFSCPYKWTKTPVGIERARDFLGDGIFNTNGTKWRIQRKQASYIFSEKSLKDVMLPRMITGTKKIVDKFSTLSTDDSFDVQKAFHDIFMDTFCQIAFGWDSKTFDTDSNFGNNYERIFQLIASRSVNPFWKVLRWLGMGFEKECAKVIKTYKTIIREVVVRAIERKKEGSRSGVKSLIERLLDISAKGEPLNPEQLIDFVSNFLLAGRDTTASTLTWALYNIISFPHTKEKLLEDIKRVREAYPGDLWSQLKNMVYVEAWIWESMRFYSPVPTIRKCNTSTATIELSDGSVIPKNSNVMIRIQASSWNPNIWKNPREFYPERHIKDGKLCIKPPEEFPTFNGGKRLCLGKKMAIMNAKLMFTELITRFEFKLSSDKPAPLQTWLITSKSSTGMWLQIKDLLAAS